ncbi:futalosine hydrolase [Flavihumibacter sp. UBA7668]|uniref:futalosine hydrolase n=1 Tax=Flavihumibacter sp. UBA7668 TaxID=1946542 RepID=UPI0025C55A9E|nr:futalosine hydrolase [Flavihumibacter sp. UBA7668]
MHCLLVAATAAEIAPFTDHLAQTEKLVHIDFDVDILITGVGAVSATYAITRYLQHKRPELIIQAGVAGCFDSTIEQGTVFAVHKEALADLGVQAKTGFQNIFEMGLAASNEAPFKQSMLINPNKTLLKRSRLKKVTAITVNEISTSKKRIQEYLEFYHPTLETMEGAALHYVCLQENIPFMQLRSVSNLVGERNKKKWNLPLAIDNLNKVLVRLLEGL